MPPLRAKDKSRQHHAKPYERVMHNETKENFKIPTPASNSSSTLHKGSLGSGDNPQDNIGFFTGLISWLSPWKKRGEKEEKIDDSRRNEDHSREESSESPARVAVGGLENFENADKPVKVRSDVGELSSGYVDDASVSDLVLDTVPIRIVRPRAVQKVDPLAAICYVCRMGRVHRRERRRIASGTAQGGHRWYSVLHHHPERDTCDLSAFSVVVGRAQNPSSRSKDYDRSRVNSQIWEPTTPIHGCSGNVLSTKMTHIVQEVSPVSQPQTVNTGKKRVREIYELNASPLQHCRSIDRDLRPGQRMRASSVYPQGAAARSETKAAHAVRRILEIMRDTDTPTAAARTRPTNRFFDSPAVEPAEDPEGHSAAKSAAGAASPAARSRASPESLWGKAKERERQKSLLAAKAGVPTKFQWPDKRLDVSLEPSGNRELDDEDGFVGGAAGPGLEAPRPTEARGMPGSPPVRMAGPGPGEATGVRAQEREEQKRILAAKAGVPTTFQWPAKKVDVSLEPSGNKELDEGDGFGKAPAVSSTASGTTAAAASVRAGANGASTGLPSLADMFKPKPGEWRCGACMSMNKPDAGTKCLSCETPKPGAAPSSSAPSAATPQFLFGASTAAASQGGFIFGAAPSGAQSSATQGFKFGADNSGTSGEFKFGVDSNAVDVGAEGNKTTASFPVFDAESAKSGAAAFKFGATSSNGAPAHSVSAPAMSDSSRASTSGFTLGASGSSSASFSSGFSAAGAGAGAAQTSAAAADSSSSGVGRSLGAEEERKAKEREDQKKALALKAGVPTKFQWPDKKVDVGLEASGNKELDEEDKLLSAPAPSTSAPSVMPTWDLSKSAEPQKTSIFSFAAAASSSAVASASAPSFSFGGSTPVGGASASGNSATFGSFVPPSSGSAFGGGFGAQNDGPAGTGAATNLGLSGAPSGEGFAPSATAATPAVGAGFSFGGPAAGGVSGAGGSSSGAAFSFGGGGSSSGFGFSAPSAAPAFGAASSGSGAVASAPAFGAGGFGAASNGAGSSFGGPSSSAAAPSFGAAAPAPGFGSAVPASAFGAAAPAPSFGAAAPSFGAAAPSFGAAAPGPSFGSTAQAPSFGAPDPVPALSAAAPAPAFGAAAAAPTFGASTPAAPFTFGAAASAPTFGAAAGGAAPSGGFSFNAPSAAAAAPAPAGSGFNFGAPSSAAAAPAFGGFGAPASQQPAFGGFGATSSAAAPSGDSGFSFGAPSNAAAAPGFGAGSGSFGAAPGGGFAFNAPSAAATAAAPPAFGAGGFGAPSASSGFGFGNGAAQPAFGGFGAPSAAAAPSAFGFGAPSSTAAPAPAFGGFGAQASAALAPGFGGFGAVGGAPAPGFGGGGGFGAAAGAAAPPGGEVPQRKMIKAKRSTGQGRGRGH